MTECNTTALPFQPRGWREIVAEFNGEMITSDAGVLLLRDANERLRPISRFAEGRILVLSVSGGNVACAISCLSEELFGSSGLEPCCHSCCYRPGHCRRRQPSGN